MRDPGKTVDGGARSLKTKKKVGTALVPATLAKKIGLKRISKTKTKELQSILGDSTEKILQMMEAGASDSAFTLIQKRLIQSVVDILPEVENNIRLTKGSRSVYQFNSLVTTLRELMADAQAIKDKGMVGDAMVERVVRPAFMDIGSTLVVEENRVSSELRDTLDLPTFKAVRRIQRDSLGRTAERINKLYDEAKNNARSYFEG